MVYICICMCVLTINEADVSCISQFGPLFVHVFVVLSVWVYLCPQTSVSVPAQAGVLDLLCFGCVCVCCVSFGRDCPFFCPGVT